MPFNGNGVFQPLAPPVYPAVTGTPISSAYFNAVMADIFAGLSNVLVLDGQSTMTGSLKMGNQKITGLAAGTQDTDAIRLGQLSESSDTGGVNIIANADRSFATIAALRAFPKPVLAAGRTLVVSLVEYAADTGLGGGQFRWQANSAVADNNGTVINPTGNITAGRWIRVDPSIYPELFGAIGDLTADDTVPVQAALANGQRVEFLRQYLTGVVEITRDGQTVFGAGGLKAKPATNTLILVSAEDVTISPKYIDTNDCLYGILSSDKNTIVEGITFSGNVGHYAILGGDNGITRNNVVLPGFDQITPFVHSGVGPLSLGNKLSDHTGFGIQFRFASNGAMIGNRSNNPKYSATIVATSGQTVFNFNLTREGCVRFGVVDNVNQRQFTSVVDNGDGTYTVTFPVGSIAGHTVTLYGWRALETYQCNSNCYDIVISGNTSDGTGDSNIVVCADYHNGVLDPGAVTEADYCDRITIVGNTCRNALANGVAGLLGKGVTVTSNTISEFGHAFDPALVNNSAISVTGCLLSVVDGNVLSGTTGRVQYGISGWRDYGPGNQPDFRNFTEKVNIGINTFEGEFTSKYFQGINFISGFRRYGVDISAGAWLPYPQEMQDQFDLAQTVPGAVDSSGYWTFATETGAAPAGRDTTNKFGGLASITVPATQAFNATPTAYNLFQNCLVKISFLARKTGSGAGGRVDVFYDNDTGSIEPRIQMLVMSTTFEKYELVIPVGSIGASGFYLRFGSSAAATTTTFQYVKVLYKPLNLQ